MLMQEWIDASQEVFGEDNSHLYNLVNRIYIKPRLDKICAGRDRHYQLAVWLNNNRTLVTRYERVVYRAYHKRIQVLSDQIAALEAKTSSLYSEL